MTDGQSTGDQHDPDQGGIVPPHIRTKIELKDHLAEWLAVWTTTHPVNSVEDFHAYPMRLAKALIKAEWVTRIPDDRNPS